jgi:hypothetical protein
MREAGDDNQIGVILMCTHIRRSVAQAAKMIAPSSFLVAAYAVQGDRLSSSASSHSASSCSSN